MRLCVRPRPERPLHGPCTGHRTCRRGEASPAPCSSGTWSPARRSAGCCWPHGGGRDASSKYASWGHPRLTSIFDPDPERSRRSGPVESNVFRAVPGSPAPCATLSARNRSGAVARRLPYSMSGFGRRRTLAARSPRVNAATREGPLSPEHRLSRTVPGDNAHGAGTILPAVLQGVSASRCPPAGFLLCCTPPAPGGWDTDTDSRPDAGRARRGWG